MTSDKTILLTIDVEDWFHVENFRPWMPPETWDQRELRVERNTHRLLDLFDSVKTKAHSSQLIAHSQNKPANELSPEAGGQKAETEKSKNSIQHPSFIASQPPARSDELKSHGQRTTDTGRTEDVIEDFRRRRIESDRFHLESDSAKEKSIKSCRSCPKKKLDENPFHRNKIRATFFVLGWIAERLPNLVREIYNRGHEVASHGYGHNLCTQLSAAELRKDLVDSKKCLEDILGVAIRGFRAPNFSISNQILQTIEDCGYRYDSSYNSFTLNKNYGSISFNGHRPNGIAHKLSEHFFELPISNIQVAGNVLPLGGGAYFRLLPASLFRAGVRLMLKRQSSYLFYLHPWEIDPRQPKVNEASLFAKFKHYRNIGVNYKKIERFIQNFSSCKFVTCSKYLEELNGFQLFS
jgi:polysaccharide deacetylase family protein (PEP-CTERM system associated)